MTTISTTADLLRILRENPDFRDEVRRLLLSQELIELPERFARFEAYVERQFDEIRGDVSRNTEDIAAMRGDIVEIRCDITVMQGDLGRLKGAEYERRVSRSFTSYASAAFRQRHRRPLRRNKLLVGAGQPPAAEYEEILAGAVETGEISDEELEELQHADAVMTGHDQGSAVYFVGEFSVTVNNHDIDRAISRASILARATGTDAWPIIVGDTIPDQQRAKVEAEGIAFRQVAE